MSVYSVETECQVRGLVEGGAHLLLLDMVSDTSNAKAAVYAIQERIRWEKRWRRSWDINGI